MFKDGIININKPEGWTSQDVCSKLRHRLHIKKAGHTGTLDPMATGVLPVCIGKATRIIEYYDKDHKSYHAEMKLGIVTDTLDITGTVMKENKAVVVDERALRDAFAGYTGTVCQIPPKYSALKVNGKRAYDLAREGVDVELKGRKIVIYSNEITDIDYENAVIGFDVECSKGTYIRTICDDIGRELGCGAVMTSLTRTGSGFFSIKDAVGIQELVEMTDEQIESVIIPMDETLTALGRVELNDKRVIAFSNGNPSDPWGFRITERSGFGNIYKVYSREGFLGTGRVENGSLIPEKVIK